MALRLRVQSADKQSDDYSAVKKLHAKFHQEAAKVVEWATSGQKEKAEVSLALGGAYAKASHVLTEVASEARLTLVSVDYWGSAISTRHSAQRGQ